MAWAIIHMVVYYVFAIAEQIVVFPWHGISAIALTAVSFPITLALAVLSWHFVE